MKRFLISLSVVAVVLSMISSSCSVKRDCQGNKKYKHAGGFYM
ncbi:MAG TPA: hypothetical protein VFO70_12795 [Chitinophagaceae bacterium]|nr:hypothetical protein [Chitinophagaceae bacterium]HEX5654142.1 hypothetical protein [Chitinophagaceae bacterium]